MKCLTGSCFCEGWVDGIDEREVTDAEVVAEVGATIERGVAEFDEMVARLLCGEAESTIAGETGCVVDGCTDDAGGVEEAEFGIKARAEACGVDFDGDGLSGGEGDAKKLGFSGVGVSCDGVRNGDW